MVSLSGAMVRRRTRQRKKRTVYTGLGAAPAKRSGAWLVLVLGGLVLVNLYVFVWDKNTGVAAIRQQAEAAHPAPAMTLPTMPLATAPAQPAVAAPLAAATALPPVAAKPPPAIEGKVGKSDTVGKLLKKNGLTAAETDELIRALSGVLDFRTIRAGQGFHITRGTDGRVGHFDLELAKGHRVRVDRKSSGELTAALE
jgi:hypothetical protein